MNRIEEAKTEITLAIKHLIAARETLICEQIERTLRKLTLVQPKPAAVESAPKGGLAEHVAKMTPPKPAKLTPKQEAKLERSSRFPAKRNANRVVRKPRLPKGLTCEPRDGGMVAWRARKNGKSVVFSEAKFGPIKAKRMALAALGL